MIMQLPEEIQTERLILKGLKTPSFELAEKLYAVIDTSRETLRVWLAWVDKTKCPEDEYTNYLVNWCKAHWETGEGFAYLVTAKDSGQILGTIDLFSVSEERKSGEIGYFLAQSAVGHGYMQEAVRALESEAFNAGINRIVIKNDTLNLRSAHVAERSGYILEGVMREDRWSDYYQSLRNTNIWAKLKADWEKGGLRK